LVPQQLLEEQRIARTREYGVQRHRPRRAMVRMVEVLVAEEPGRGVAAQDDARANLPDDPRDVDPNTVGVLQLAVVVIPDRDALQAGQAARVLALDPADRGELGPILVAVLRPAVAVREDQEMDLAALLGPLAEGPARG